MALDYARVRALIRFQDRVFGVCGRDEFTVKTFKASAKVVINASGAWADGLRTGVSHKKRIRPLRGSHLFFSLSRFPVYQAIAFSHPEDGRPVFVYPWEGVSLVGTTDVDHKLPLDKEPSISEQEADYLLRAVQDRFSELELTKADVISTQAGVRPVVDTGKAAPSAESRDHVVWLEHGLLTVTGGKLTTFRLIAIDALRAAQELSKQIPVPDPETEALDTFDPSLPIRGVNFSVARRLWGRYGAAAPLLAFSDPGLLKGIPGTPYLWAELVWAAEHEAVYHLDDLLLRRFRLGILLADGGQSLLPRLKILLQDSLGWKDEHWAAEVERYRCLWQVAHGLPPAWQHEMKL